MPVLLVMIFVGVPLLELFVILQVGSAIGGWSTALLLVVFSVVGALLLRFEGRRAWSEFRRALGEGRWPGDEVAQGALIIVGGTLLVTPGFMTDLVGFLLLLGPTRRLVARRVRLRTEAAATGARGSSRTARTTRSAAGPRRRPGNRRPGAGRAGPAGPGSGWSGSSGGDAASLEVEVVEIRREQPTLDDTAAGTADDAGPEDDVEDRRRP